MNVSTKNESEDYFEKKHQITKWMNEVNKMEK